MRTQGKGLQLPGRMEFTDPSSPEAAGFLQ